MTRLRRLLRRRLAIAALTALTALALAVPAGARTALEPGQNGPGSQGVSLRLADASSPPVAKSPSVSLRLADASSPPIRGGVPVSLRLADASSPRVADTSTATVATAHRRGIPATNDSDISGLAFILSLVGVGIVAAGAATVVTARAQQRGHSTA
jgi:hypothetical protein